MPRQVFSDDLEEKLIALWAEYQTKKSGIMKRTKKEKEIADKLNLYAKEIGEDMEFSHSITHNKIDNLKSKAKEHYKKFRRATATGSAVDSTSDEAFDLEKAYNMWANFRTWHCLFRDVPGFGPLATISSVSLTENEQPSSASLAISPSPSPLSVPAGVAAIGVQRRTTGDDSDEELEAVDPDPRGNSFVSAASVPTTPTYNPGSLKRKFARAAEVDEFNQDREEDGNAQKKKKKVVATNNALSAGASMFHAFGETQRELQNNQQQFLSNLMQEQRAHTQMLAQSQMEFQAKIFGKLFSEKD